MTQWIRCADIPSRLPTLQLITLPKGTVIFRVGLSGYASNAWDARRTTNYRFSPLLRGESVIPVLYGGDSDEVALTETILRFGDGLDERDLESRYLAELKTTRDLHLIPLAGPNARPLGDSVAVSVSNAPASEYAHTRHWAAALKRAHPGADGLMWISHQHGADRAYLFWRRASRSTTAPLTEIDIAPLTDAGLRARAIDLALRSGLAILGGF